MLLQIEHDPNPVHSSLPRAQACSLNKGAALSWMNSSHSVGTDSNIEQVSSKENPPSSSLTLYAESFTMFKSSSRHLCLYNRSKQSFSLLYTS